MIKKIELIRLEENNKISVDISKTLKNIKVNFDSTYNKESLDFAENLLINFFNYYQEAAEIMNTSNCSKESIQERLENLNTPFKQHGDKIRYQLPKNLVKKVNEINKLTNFENSEDHYLKTIVPNLQSRGRISKERAIFLKKFHNALKKMKEMNEDFGLMVLFYVATNYRELAIFVVKDNTKFQKLNFLEKNEKFKSDLIKSFEESIKKEKDFNLNENENDESSFLFNRTTFLRKLTTDLKNAISMLINLSKYEKEDNKEFTFNLDEKEQKYFMEHIAFYLEKCELITINQHEHSSHYNYRMPKNLIESMFHLSSYSPNLPLIVKPCDWIQHKKKGEENIVLGGYRTNDVNLFPGVHLKGRFEQAIIPDKTLKNINYLQGTEFCVNKTMLEYLTENFAQIFYYYLEESNSKRYVETLQGIVFSKDKNSVTIYNEKETVVHVIKELKNKYVQITDSATWNILSKQKNINIIKKETNYKVLEEIQENFNKSMYEYRKSITMLINIFGKLYLGELFKDQKIYFNVFVDYRGRIYFSGYPLSPTLDTLSKLLLIFFKNDADYTTVPRMIPKNEDKFFDELKEHIEITKEYIENDVTCSGVQIAGGLTGSLSELVLTNFIIKNGDMNHQIKDLYNTCLISLMNAINKEIKLMQDEKDILIYQELLTIINNRSFIKGWVMRYMYSEGDFTRTIDLKTVLIKKMSTQEFENKKIKILHREKEINDIMIFEKAYYISKKFKETFNYIFPEIIKLSTELREKFYTKNCKKVNQKNKTHIIIQSSENSIKTLKNFCKKEKKQFKTYSFQKKGFIQTVFFTDTQKRDNAAISQSIMPNFIHHLDSQILINVVNTFQEKQYPIFTAHDCFKCKPEHKEFVKEAYFNAFKEIILKEDPLKFFLTVNELEYNKTISENFNLNKQKILDEIEQRNYLISPYILKE